MNTFIENLNLWGGFARGFVWPLLWQSSLLIAVVFCLDLSLRRRVRAAVRYGLWLVVLIKLMLPPSLALPTSLAWWLPSSKPAAATPQFNYVVKHGSGVVNRTPITPSVRHVTPAPTLSADGCGIAVWAGVTVLLLGWLVVHWRLVGRDIASAVPGTAELEAHVVAARHDVGLRRAVRVRLTGAPMSPAVCGLFRPVILLPRSLVEQLPPAQLRAVLLHELVHLRRADVWVNCLQALLQIVYWWHPLVWLANARIRRLREEAVDDAVLLVLREEADHYAPTLLEVARLAFHRPLASLGLVGILESRSTLRQRIERLVNLPPPRKAGVSTMAALGIMTFAALAVPMGQSPSKPSAAQATSQGGSPFWPDARYDGYVNLDLRAEFLSADAAAVKAVLPRLIGLREPWVLSSNEVAGLGRKLEQAHAETCAGSGQLTFQSFSGGRFHWNVGGGSSNNCVNYQTRADGDCTVVVGADIEYAATAPDWTPMIFTAVPWAQGNGLRCEVSFESSANAGAARRATVAIPRGGAMIWGVTEGVTPGKCQIVLLRSAGNKVEPDSAELANQPPAGDQPDSFHTRTFKFEPSIIIARLQERGYLSAAEATEAVPQSRPASASTGDGGTQSGARTNLPAPVARAFRAFLADAGLEFQPPRALYFNYGNGRLIARARLSELDSLQAFIEELNCAPPQIHLTSKFIEMPEPVYRELRESLPPTDPNAGTNWTSVLTPARARTLVHELEVKRGVIILSSPEVTTHSERQAQVQTVDIRTIVTGINPQALSAPGLETADGTNGLFRTEPRPFGFVLDLLPALAPDGYSIRLRIAPQMTEFLGYDKPKRKTTVFVKGKKNEVKPPLPRFRVRQATAEATLWDGQTVVIGGLSPVEISTLPDGESAHEPSRNTRLNRLVVFVRATILDAAGNRIHTENEMPFANAGVPPQSPL